eukprot:m.147976 g.147976  ORF g.147976 m.147976 type:complete len:220 (+) comp15053_c0_seq1:368-1027(+)
MAAAAGDELGAGDENAEAFRKAGFKIVRFGPKDMVYVGQVDSQNRPQGTGYLYFPNGDLHEGLFEAGRAHGDGVYFTTKGDEFRGSWTHNKRRGVFHVLDAEGTPWTEKYDDEGKRTVRKKDRVKVPNPAHNPDAPREDVPEFLEELVPKKEPAVKCWTCNGFARASASHGWSCRAHKGRWTVDRSYRGEGQAPGVWACCGREVQAEPGCSFAAHNFMT